MEQLKAFYLGMPPLVQGAVLGGMLAAFALLVMCFLRNKILKAGLFISALVCTIPALNVAMIYYPELIDPRFRVYKQFYGEITPGMSHEDVIFTEQKFYPVGGDRQTPRTYQETPDFIGFFMSPEDRDEPRAEAIHVYLKDGKVTQKAYVADD